VAGGGVEFTCLFGAGVNRAYWDRTVAADLSTATCLEFDLTCENPEALQALSIYLKSDKGWFVAQTHIAEAGRQRVIFPRGAFVADSKPAGWQRIEAIRFSPWRGQPKNTRLILHGVTARLGGVVVIEGSTSVGDNGERKAAQRATRLISTWLSELGIGHDVVLDDDAAAALKTARVAILPYNSKPNSRELKALAAFTQQGGKLIVFYGASEELAKLMHMRIGAYEHTETPGRWSAISFVAPAAWDVPARVRQESGNIMPAVPADSSASVIAWWENRLGGRTSSPAWTASVQGFWMAHVLQDEDLTNKRRMLAGLLGKLDPDVWPQAAVQAYYRAGCMGGAASFAASRTRLAADPAKLAEADRLYAGLAALFKARRYPEVVDQAATLDRMLTEVYAAVQPAPKNEFRGVWEHNGVGWYPGDWGRTCRELKENHLTAVFGNMLWGALAHYPSDVLPRSTTFHRYGDQLDAAVKAAHANGLQFHCWAVCWNPGGAPEDFMARLKKAGRLQQTADGKSAPWLSPHHPDNVEMLLKAYEEVAQRYPIDGLHLDYIRYSDHSVDFSPVARAAFEKWRGGTAFGWPKSAQNGGALFREFNLFRCETITAFVREASKRVRAARPGITISAAVFAGYRIHHCVFTRSQQARPCRTARHQNFRRRVRRLSRMRQQRRAGLARMAEEWLRGFRLPDELHRGYQPVSCAHRAVSRPAERRRPHLSRPRHRRHGMPVATRPGHRADRRPAQTRRHRLRLLRPRPAAA
ncbi:MAG: family 10 glycosylhydrolase, partial [Kiritimatiellaeota bacterium]|nr:family 10 glycosylhydrolase [Kiritimatiellota bacterium]